MSEPISPDAISTDASRPFPVFLAQSRVKRRYWLHILLFVLTAFTTMVVGAGLQFNFQQNLPAFTPDNGVLPFFHLRWALAQLSRLLLGVPFSAALMLILLAHEMGHYLCCEYYGVYATLPFFIPAPTLIGTLGAFIRIRSPIRSRTALFDIGIAGPIAGFVVAVTVLFIAMPHSKLITAATDYSDIELGYPLIFRLAWAILPLAHLKSASSSLHAIYFHPVVIAAWVGMFATALNLLPGGQLDGGHIVFAIAPEKHRWVSRLAILALIPMALYYWAGWLLWAILLRLSGMRHPMVAEWPGISGGRRWLAVVAILMLILTLTPSPILMRSSGDESNKIIPAKHGSLLDIFQEMKSSR
ncbi:MAG: site-2 protease family protein [Terriglobales bacterium]